MATDFPSTLGDHPTSGLARQVFDESERPTSTSRSTAADAAFDRSWTCRACDTPGASTSWQGSAPHAGGSPDRFRIAHCDHCGLTFTVPQLSIEEVGPYYPKEYYGDQNARFHPVMEALSRWLRRRRARALECWTNARGRVLDIGCGRGLTLATLRERGWEVEGVELSSTAAQHARDHLKLNVTLGGFDPTRYADSQFDAVIIWHVLEHVPDPLPALEGIARILKPGGVLALAVPNSAGWQAKLTKYDWFHLDLPRHYWHFSAPWLHEKLPQLGLDVKHAGYGSLEQNPYGWIQSLLNRCGLRHNLLYDLLRSPSARNVRRPWREYPLQSLVSILGLAVLAPLAGLLTFAEAAFHAGGTIELYAVKRDPR
ncbi:MAG: class I SAM-dependent methyltransferase [Planctomycetia bacterium]|nr:class I SAM-dependent methyltransferase [Planctomycetia bacterium]